MIHLLNIEFSKIRNYSTFWVILLIYIGLVPTVFFLFSQIEIPFLPNDAQLYGFPSVWSHVTWTASWLNLLLGVLVVTLTCNEISYKTQRQNIIDGLSRTQMILSKVFFFSYLSLFVTIYTFFIGFIFGVIYSGTSEMFTDVAYVGIYFIQTLGYFTFAFLFAILFKSPSLSIIFYVLIFMFKFIFKLILGGSIAQYLPINIISDLIPFPFFKEIISISTRGNHNSEAPVVISQTIRLMVALGWISIFLFLSYFIIRRRDL